MKRLFPFTAVLFLAGLRLASAQFVTPDGLPLGFNHALLDVFMGGPSFSGRATLQIPGTAADPPTNSVPCDIAILNGAMRLEVESLAVASNTPPTQAANFRQMHSITIVRPDRNRMYLVYPAVHSFVELAYWKSSGTDPMPMPRVSRGLTTNETVGDQGCLRSDWTFTEANGQTFGVTAWCATNLNNFPVQLKIGSPPVLVDFQDLHLKAPEPGLFEPPPGYTKYAGIQSVIEQQAAGIRNTNNGQ